MNWVVIVVAVLVAFVSWGYLSTYLRRRRLERFLSARGVDFVRVKLAGSYGWPGYVVVFASQEKRIAFRQSPAYEALLDEVRKMHGDEEHDGRRFNVEWAVRLA